MCRDDISKRIDTLVGENWHAVTTHLLEWPESYAFYHREEHVGLRANHRSSSAKRKLDIFKAGVVDALIAHGVRKSDIDTYYDPIRNWVCTCFLRGYITWGKESDWKDKQNMIKEFALGMMVAVDELTISTEDIVLVERIVPHLLKRRPCKYIAEELDSEVDAIKEDCQRIDKLATTKCLQDALVVTTDHLSDDERQVSGLFVSGQSVTSIVEKYANPGRDAEKVKKTINGVVQKATLLKLLKRMEERIRNRNFPPRMSEAVYLQRRDIFKAIVAGVSVEYIAKNQDLSSLMAKEKPHEEKIKSVESYVEFEVGRKILLDLQAEYSKLKQRRESLLRAMGGHPTDLTGPDVEVLSTVAMIQSWVRVWVKTKYRESKKHIGEAYRRGIVELQESWNVDSDSADPSSSRRRCRLATTSFNMWNNCARYSGGPQSCGLSLDPAEGQASGQASYNEWGECRFLGDGADQHLPMYNRLVCLREVEKVVEKNYRAAARNFVSAKLPEVRWWWDQWPGEAGSEERRWRERSQIDLQKYARDLEASIDLSTVVDLLKWLRGEEARIVRLATEGHSIATIAGKCDKTKGYIRGVLSKIAAKSGVLSKIAAKMSTSNRRYSRLTGCWKR